MAVPPEPLGWEMRAGTGTAVCRGDWRVTSAAAIEKALARLPAKPAAIDIAQLTNLDTAGAWLIHRLAKANGVDGLIGATPDRQALIDLVARQDRPRTDQRGPVNPLREFVGHVGRAAEGVAESAYEFIGFLGLSLAAFARCAVRPWRIRFTSLVFHIEEIGLNALPIVGLLSFLIGMVMAYQGADQLRRFGAEIFVVNLLGISILRELGVLMTSIIVAGRSGSAFTAQIGSMKLREELDAMRTIGLDPMEVLVVPRAAALVIALPILTFWGDITALVGGALMAWSSLDLPPRLFLTQLLDAVAVRTFVVGIVKAPVFAVLIAVVGCFMGMKVTGSAESVGQMTTRSVVMSIFLVIVADALFSIFFTAIRL